MRFELERHRCLEREREKWEERETRLVRQLETLKVQPTRLEKETLQHPGTPTGPSLGRSASDSVPIHEESLGDDTTGVIITPQEDTLGQTPAHDRTAAASPPTNRTSASADTLSSQISTPASTIPRAAQEPADCSMSASSPLLAQQVPPIAKFSGEDCTGEGQDFAEWFEQFELVASACNWNEQAKLVNLATRLKGQAYSFYRACTPDQ